MVTNAFAYVELKTSGVVRFPMMVGIAKKRPRALRPVKPERNVRQKDTLLGNPVTPAVPFPALVVTVADISLATLRPLTVVATYATLS